MSRKMASPALKGKMRDANPCGQSCNSYNNSEGSASVMNPLLKAIFVSVAPSLLGVNPNIGQEITSARMTLEGFPIAENHQKLNAELGLAANKTYHRQNSNGVY